MSKNSIHNKLHKYVGYGVIIILPLVLLSAVEAIKGGSQGFTTWLSNPVGGIGFLAFFTAAIWYCKLELDEVILDYFDGKLRSTSLIVNRLVALIVWFTVANTITRLILG